MAKDFDDLLAVHHLLDEPFRLADGFLLAHEIPRRVAADFARDQNHADHAEHHDQRQPEAVIEHDAQNREHDDAGHEQLREALGDHLPQGIDIVGVVAHDIAVAVRIEKADGQVLHPAEHLHPKLFERALGDDGHHAVEREAGGQREHIEHHQQADEPKNLPAHGAPVAALPAGLHDGDDILHEDGGNRVDDGAEQDAPHNHGHHHRVEGKEHANQPLGRPFFLPVLLTGHPAHLPYSGKYRLPGKFRSAPAAARASRQR